MVQNPLKHPPPQDIVNLIPTVGAETGLVILFMTSVPRLTQNRAGIQPSRLGVTTHSNSLLELNYRLTTAAAVVSLCCHITHATGLVKLPVWESLELTIPVMARYAIRSIKHTVAHYLVLGATGS